MIDADHQRQYSLHMRRFTPGELGVKRLLWEHGALKPSEIQKLYPEPIKNPALRSYPCLIGLWRPMILLPERQCEADRRAELPSIFAHELTHLLRRDLAWNALFHGWSILLWPHPLVWRVRITHADACNAVSDAVAAGFVGDANVYARTLALLALRVTSRGVSMGLSMARESCTRRRIEAVQRHVFRARLSRSQATFALAVAALVPQHGTGLSSSREFVYFSQTSLVRQGGYRCQGQLQRSG